MSEPAQLNLPVTAHTQMVRHDARDLLALLYREIGISAVAAALQINVESERRAAASVKSHPVPGVLRGNDIAA